jgi:spermidine/putrescine transport system ATP-binding protein
VDPTSEVFDHGGKQSDRVCSASTPSRANYCGVVPMPVMVSRSASVINEAQVSDVLLTVESVCKSFGSHVALRPLDLQVARGEFLTLLGPSGCGKTTLLRIIGGFEQADTGRVLLAGKDLLRVPPERRPFNTVFQSYALFPHMTVEENVAYGLRTKGSRPADIRQKVAAMLELVHLGSAAKRSVRELSGGQQQRIALARALVNEPEVLLLDEPLGALDLQLRRRLQEELRAIQEKLGTTCIYVTHDQEEALALSHRIVVMEQGRLVQVGAPQELYERPVSRFVAQFVGEANLIPGVVAQTTGAAVMVDLDAGSRLTLAYNGSKPLSVGQSVLAVLRPEHLRVCDSGTAALSGAVERSIFLGTHTRHDVVLADGTRLRFHSGPHEGVGAVGELLDLEVVSDRGVVVPAAEDFIDARLDESSADT